jgi:hypothetical protein
LSINSRSSTRPSDAEADEAVQRQLHLARAQGDSYGAALDDLLHALSGWGGERRIDEYWIGCAVERADGVWEWRSGELRWSEPDAGAVNVQVMVRDASDGRFTPGVRVLVSMIAASGRELGTYEQPLIWHPMLYHYGRTWEAIDDGLYTLRVRVEPPRFARRDRINGRRFREPVEVEFNNVRVDREQP